MKNEVRGMRTLCKSLMILVVSMISWPALLAQAVDPELYQLSNGIGYNKYLTSTTPNANGEYTLRLESFVTASVTTQVIPTDYVIVLATTGSMQWDYTQPGDPAYTRDYITKEENDALLDSDPRKLRSIANDNDLDKAFISYTRYTYNTDEGTCGYTQGKYGQRAEHNTWTESDGNGGLIQRENNPLIEGQRKSPPGFLIEASRWYWDADDNKYYRIHGEHVQGQGSDIYDPPHDYESTNHWNYYNLYYNKVNNDGTITKVFFHSHNGGINTQKQRPWTTNYPDSIILNVEGYENLIFRPASRREVELNCVNEFIDQIAAENAKNQWASGVTKHQIALVTYGGDYEHPDDLIREAVGRGKTQVAKRFGEVTNANKADFKSSITACAWWSYAGLSDRGVNLAKLLFEELQQNNAFKPLNTSNKVNRNKVVVFISDGRSSGGTTSVIVHDALEYAFSIKQPRTTYSGTEINGKIFTVDLNNADKATQTIPYMEHLSSNYPDGRTASSESIHYKQSSPTESGYYMRVDDVSTGLQKAFGYTATAATGPRIGSQLVIVDRMSDGFVLPSGNLTGKVKFYTAQCIGTKTISGGTSNPYLAFASPVQANTRSTLNHLWVSSGSGGSTQWTDVGSRGNKNLEDIDNNITYTVSDDRKTITIKGFKYSDLWCGQDLANDNTRHTVSSSDPNYNNQLYGYRGFKLIAEIPVVLASNAVGGPNLGVSDSATSGVYDTVNNEGTTPQGNPLVTFPVPELSVPVRLVIQKTGLAAGESASFTLQRRLASGSSSTYTDYATFIITGDGTTNPEVKIMHLDPAYHYCVKETGWSWSYTIDSTVYSTEQGTGLTRILTNPIVFTNAPDNVTAKRGEDKVTNDFPATTP